MSDYTTPAVSDESVINLANAINSFYTEISGDVGNINEMLAEVITKHYSVNHEPQIELPFEKEYEYIKDKVNKSLSGSKKLDNFTHIFISGYLPNGKTIHYDALEEDDKGHTFLKYAGLFINGKQIYGDYTCRAEEGGWEKLNVLIIGAPKMSPYNARLDVDYSDIPLKDFKMIVFDDLEEPVSPNIDSFLAQKIDTLKHIGNLKWTYGGISTLRKLELTGNLMTIADMHCVCLQELIIPAVINVPNVNVGCGSKPSITTLDISKATGTVGYLAGVSLGGSLSLNCNIIYASAFSGAILDSIRIGTNCNMIMTAAFSTSTITSARIDGNVEITSNAFEGCAKLTTVTFGNNSIVKFTNTNSFRDCTSLSDLHFANIASMSLSCFNGCSSIKNITFANDKIISCPLYFQFSPILTEQSCLNIINAIADNAKVSISLHQTVKTHMANDWHCKLSGGKYISCTADDAGAITQADAIIARGGTLA